MRLKGKVNQLTIMGQLEFIDGEEYNVNNLDKTTVEVSGLFHLLSTDTIEPFTINMHKLELKKHTII